MFFHLVTFKYYHIKNVKVKMLILKSYISIFKEYTNLSQSFFNPSSFFLNESNAD